MKWRESYSESATPPIASELDFHFTPSELLTVHVERLSFALPVCLCMSGFESVCGIRCLPWWACAFLVPTEGDHGW